MVGMAVFMRGFRGQFDILTMLVLTTAVAVTCALVRSPLRLDVKILAISTELAVFLVWALWYYESLRTHFPAIGQLVNWAFAIGLYVYLFFPLRFGGTRSEVLLSTAGLAGIGLALFMFFRQLYKLVAAKPSGTCTTVEFRKLW